MRSLRKIVSETIQESLVFHENVQLADKLFFKTGKLTPEDREIIHKITGGDNFTNLVADTYYFVKNVIFKGSDDFFPNGLKMVRDFYKQAKSYDKNIFPVQYDLNSYNQQNNSHSDYHHIIDLLEMLREREYAINQLRKLPSIAIRNLKSTIKTPSINKFHFQDIATKLKELNSMLAILPKDEVKRNILINKIFASRNKTLDDVVKTASKISSGFNPVAAELSKKDLIRKINNINADLIQDSGDILVIRANDKEAIEELGCTSLWCFSIYGSNSDFWESYAQLGFVYVIFDFAKEYTEANFLMVMLPDSGEVYASTNVPLYELGIHDTHEYLISIGVDITMISRDEAEMEKIRVEKQRAEQPEQPEHDPAQLSLFEIKRYLYKHFFSI